MNSQQTVVSQQSTVHSVKKVMLDLVLKGDEFMSRSEILLKERNKVMINIASDINNRTKWLVALMDIDDEIEELSTKK